MLWRVLPGGALAQLAVVPWKSTLDLGSKQRNLLEKQGISFPGGKTLVNIQKKMRADSCDPRAPVIQVFWEANRT